MRKIPVLLFLMMLAQTALSQSNIVKWDSIKCYCCNVETAPTYTGGQAALLRFLSSNFQCPPSVQDEDFCGQIVVQYVVDKTGNPTDIKVLNSFNADFSNEAIRVIKLSKWEPATRNGRNISYRQKLSFHILLSGQLETTPTFPAGQNPIPIT